eukprot:130116-Prymnesium_polylepis.1
MWDEQHPGSAAHAVLRCAKAHAVAARLAAFRACLSGGETEGRVSRVCLCCLLYTSPSPRDAHES